jgi:DHA2 family multidrug resistance protein
MPIIGKMVGKVDPRGMLIVGIVGVTASLWMNAHLTNEAGFWDLTRPMFIRAISMGFMFIPLSMLALSNLPHAQRGNATGLFNLTRELGGSIGTAWMGLMVDRGVKIHGSYLREAVYASNPIVQETTGAIQGSLGAQTFQRELVAESVLELKVRLQALVLSFNDGFKRATLVFLGCLVLAAFLKRPSGSGPVADAH